MLIIFDADNTIWDTNKVFENAQLSLLEVLREEGIHKDLATLREIEYYLFLNYGNFENSFGLLCDILADNDLRISKKAHKVFLEQLKNLPPLFSDAQALMQSISNRKDITKIIFTEGKQERINRILKEYPMVNDFFDFILFTESKNYNEWERAGSIVECSKVICVRDSLKRDIKFAKKAGMFTIYRPGGFWGEEIPKEKDEVPSLYVKNLTEAMPI